VFVWSGVVSLGGVFFTVAAILSYVATLFLSCSSLLPRKRPRTALRVLVTRLNAAVGGFVSSSFRYNNLYRRMKRCIKMWKAAHDLPARDLAALNDLVGNAERAVICFISAHGDAVAATERLATAAGAARTAKAAARAAKTEGSAEAAAEAAANATTAAEYAAAVAKIVSAAVGEEEDNGDRMEAALLCLEASARKQRLPPTVPEAPRSPGGTAPTAWAQAVLLFDALLFLVPFGILLYAVFTDPLAAAAAAGTAWLAFSNDPVAFLVTSCVLALRAAASIVGAALALPWMRPWDGIHKNKLLALHVGNLVQYCTALLTGIRFHVFVLAVSYLFGSAGVALYNAQHATFFFVHAACSLLCRFIVVFSTPALVLYDTVFCAPVVSAELGRLAWS
jgi:hypothetical protein